MVSEERVRYLIEWVGGDVAAQGATKIATALQSSQRAADQHSAALRANARMQAEMQRAAERNAAAQRALSQSMSASVAPANAAGATFKDSAKSVNALAGAFSILSPQLAQFTPAIQSMAGSFGDLTKTIGGSAGAIGVTVIGALTLYGEIIDRETKRQAEFEKSIEDSTKALREQQIAAAAAFSKREAERFSEEAEAAAQGRTVQQLRADRAALDEVNRAEELAATRGQIGPNVESRGPATAAPFNPDRADRLTEADALLRKLQSQADEAKARADRFGKTRFDDSAVADAGVAGAVKAQEEMEKASASRMKQLADFEAEQERERWERKEEAATQYYDSLRSMATETYGIISSSAAGLAAAIARGEKITAKAVLQTIGSEIVGRGTGNLLDAIFRAANPITAVATNAAGQIPLALAQIAAGSAMAGVGAALPGGGSGAGGGGRPSSPTYFVEPSRETGAKNPTTVIVNMPTTVSATHYDGMRVQEGLDEARRKGRI